MLKQSYTLPTRYFGPVPRPQRAALAYLVRRARRYCRAHAPAHYAGTAYGRWGHAPGSTCVPAHPYRGIAPVRLYATRAYNQACAPRTRALLIRMYFVG